MHIRLNIEMRCARRQNDAAYQQYRRRSVSGRHAIIIHRRQVQHQSSRGMFLTLWMARLPLRHRPIVLRSPVNGSESAIGRGCIRATGWDAFLLKPLLRVPYVYSAYRTQPKYNILTSTRLLRWRWWRRGRASRQIASRLGRGRHDRHAR